MREAANALLSGVEQLAKIVTKEQKPTVFLSLFNSLLAADYIIPCSIHHSRNASSVRFASNLYHSSI